MAAEFNQRYAGVNLRRDALTEEQKNYWYQCQGRFVTDFLRELHEGLKSQGKTLTMILDAAHPDEPQAWWGKPLPGAGNTRMEWQRWIKEGLVDELWVQLALVADQRHLLDRLLEATRGTSVKLTARVMHPFKDASWKRYNDAGVILTACITAPVNDIERVTLEPTQPETIHSDDWRLRVQTMADMASGLIAVDTKLLAAGTRDSHVLVRRKALQALQALKAVDQVEAIEAALNDLEHSVRLAATKALVAVHGPNSLHAVLQAAENDPSFVLKTAEVEALGAMGAAADSAVLSGLESTHAPVREVCVRALRLLSRGQVSGPHFTALSSRLLAPEAPAIERYWAADSLSKLQAALTVPQRAELVADLIKTLAGKSPPMVQLRTATALGSLVPLLVPAQKQASIGVVRDFFHQFGKDCARSDAAFGWRVAGNTLLEFGRPGRAILESFRTQTEDPWLAWFAYEVVYEPEQGRKMILTTEAEAIANHTRYAPPFPGWRTWHTAGD